MQPTEWGWCERDEQYVPIPTDKPAAPTTLLNVVRCNCKAGCSNRQCTCRANGLECTTGCGVCRGTCTNTSAILEENEDTGG